MQKLLISSLVATAMLFSKVYADDPNSGFTSEELASSEYSLDEFGSEIVAQTDNSQQGRASKESKTTASSKSNAKFVGFALGLAALIGLGLAFFDDEDHHHHRHGH